MKVLCIKIPFTERWLVLPTFKTFDRETLEVIKVLREPLAEAEKRQREVKTE